MRARVILSLSCAAALAGCMADVKTDLGDPVDEGAGKSDFFSMRVDVAANIAFGETVTGAFAESGYTGYTFAGARGSRAVIDLIGEGNDPMLYVYGPMVEAGDWGRARRVARNDDYGRSLNSHLDVRLPADGTYLILTREYWDEGGAFTLSLACDGANCRPECRGDACPTGSYCERIYCITTPCPSYCAPDPVVTHCGGRLGDTCGEGQYCHYEEGDDCGRSDRTGVCAPQPTICTREFMPTCGCDGQTYSNRCSANAAGTSVDYVGACAPTGACTEEECGPRSRAANILCDDGVTIGGPTDNCRRAEDGTCGWEWIECPATVQSCGSRGLSPCPEGQFCNFPETASCGAADHPGTCAPIPEVCTRDYRPVCGCDGRTYSNPCTAHSAGVSVASEGECAVSCRVAGCSGQLCVADGEGGISTCEWREEYACYRGATCETQADGRCGWTATPELEACLSGAGS